MHIRFTKMQGAGNDFVVLDETQGRLGLTPAHYRFLADRHFGVGADQILTVRPAPADGLDFEYVIHNADGGEVEQCGNGARCFARYVYDKGLTSKTEIRVQTKAGVIAPRLTDDGRVTVNMGRPVLDAAQVPFDVSGLTARQQSHAQVWPLALPASACVAQVEVVAVSMGNPHAVQWVENVDTAPVAELGPLVELHPRFPQRVNAGLHSSYLLRRFDCVCMSVEPVKPWRAGQEPVLPWLPVSSWGNWSTAWTYTRAVDG